MRPRPLLFACLALCLLGLAAASFKLRLSPLPVGDEATHVLMARSLWEDHDLLYEKTDLDRAYRIWNEGPAGLSLLTTDGSRTLRYGEPLAWALVATPAWGLFGAAGLPILNMALFLAMLAGAVWLFQDSNPLFLGGFFFASASFGYVFRGSPEVFLMASVFFALLLWKREKPVPAGVLLGVASLYQPWLALLGLALIVSRRKGAIPLLLAGILAFGVLSIPQWDRGAQRRTFEADFPLESDTWQSYGDQATVADIGLLPRNFWYFLVGRNTGLIPAFPFAVLALIFLARDRWPLLAAIGIILLLGLVLEPHRWHGGPGALGNARFAVLYPAFLFLPRSFPRWSLVPAFAAAGLWTSVLVAGAIVPPPPHPGEIATFRVLPLELTLLGEGVQLPGYGVRNWGQGLWVVPRASFWMEEGVWVRGASASEIVVISPKPLKELRFRVDSPGENEILLEGAERVLVRFDGKRNGAPVRLPLEPAATGLGLLPGTEKEWIYRFTLTVRDGIIPARRQPGNQDPRYLGVFLDL
ncbi:MAG TPA: glycosyltransferase family 87 protein [Thermoanaerobaculia bacterium]|nr:glycosyltransferase family 87 protein [Thermoanaerobaculia bacterium]